MTLTLDLQNIHRLPVHHRVLLISDQPHIAWEDALEEIGSGEAQVEILAGHSVDAAENLIESFRPDVIVADIAFLSATAAGLHLARTLDEWAARGRAHCVLVSAEAPHASPATTRPSL